METLEFTPTDGGVVAAAGFTAAGVAAGIKKNDARDVALIVAEKSCAAAALFTTNAMAAAPVVVSRRNIASGLVRAAVVNSGNANACTGAQGESDAVAMAETVALSLGCASDEVVVASTGVIGVPMPLDLVLNGIEQAASELEDGNGDPVAEAIMTTDTFSKQCAVSLEVGGRRWTVGGMAKGSGMIEPNMATMLAFVTTDAPLTRAACDAALRAANARSFSRITVDSDTSTNDMVLLMASGAAGGDAVDVGSAGFDEISAAIEHVCADLARQIVRDGEGATKFISVTVRGAGSEDDALLAAKSIANSPLFKTAIFGRDANWGRVVMALGKSGARIDPTQVDVVFAGITTCRNGTGSLFDEEAAAAALAEHDIEVVVDLHMGEFDATVWTCDLSYEYVRINGEYRT